MATSSYSINFNGTLAELGEEQVFTFEGGLGDRLLFDSIDTDASFENITYRLIDPSGDTVIPDTFHTNDRAPITLTQTGTYQIVFQGSASTTGDYNLNLIKINQAPALTLGTTISNTLTPGVESDVYRFTGTKGQRLQFDSLIAVSGALWRLYGTNSQTVFGSQSIGSDFTATLPTDGEYYLVLDGFTTSGSVNYSFQVNDVSDPPPAAPTTFPFAQSGNVVSGTPANFTFSATAGQLLYFDSLDPDFDGVNVEIFDPTNTSVSSSNASSDFIELLPRSGTYTVRITGSGDYNFRILDLQANATALTLGTPVTETLSPTSGTRVFSFTGAVGQRLVYDSLESDFDSVSATIIGPSGNQIVSFGNSSSDSNPFTIAEAGTYYLLQQGTSTSAADFSFKLIDATAASTISLDTVVNGTLSPGQESDFYRFTAAAGQRLVFDAISGSGPIFRVYDQGNSQITAAGITSDREFTAPEAGTYLLEIEGNSTTNVSYSFQLVSPTTSSTPLTLGSTVAGTISELGEQDIYTFSGTAGQRLIYDATVNNNNNLLVRLFSPSGALVGSQIGSDFDGNLVTLTETGTYQLIVEGSVGSTNSTGDYDFKLIDATAASTISLDTVVNGTLSPGQESDFYRFTAAAGQRLVFDAISGSGPIFRVYDQGNSQITAAGITSDREFTAPEAGTYLLEIEGNSTTNVSYSFQLVSPTTSSTPLTLGSTVAGTISELGEQDIYTFSGTAGQRLIYDATVNNNNTLLVRLFSPSGALVGSQIASDFDGSLVTLTENGTYQLIVEGSVGSTNSTGDYDFKLIDATAASIISLDTVVNGTLSPGQESDFYRFTAAAGQRLVFDAISGSGPIFRVYDQGNSQITAAGITSDREFTAPEAGTYLLEIEGNSTTNVSYSFQLVSPTTSSTPLTLGSTVAGTISELGEQDIYTFSGTAGQRLIYDATVNNNNTLLVRLFSPSGALVGSQIASDFDGNLVTLTETGTYQLIVEGSVGSTNSTGDYDFKLIDATAASTISLDTVVNGTLSPGQESDFYRFTAAAGQRLVFDAISGSGPIFRVYDQGNSQITAAGITSDREFTAPEAGTYLLEIEGNSTTNVSYSFQLVSPTTSSTPLTLGSTVAGTITELGEQDIYTFSGTAGQRLIYDATVNNSNNLLVRLFSPSGAVVGSQIGSDFDGNLVTLTENGTYQLIVEGSVGFTSSTGNYNFKLIDATAAPAISLGTPVIGMLSPGTESDFYRITGTAGQQLSFDSLAASTGANWRLFDPLNSQRSATNAGSDFSAILEVTGTYLLELEGNSTGDVSYNFTVTDSSSPPPASPTPFPFSRSGTVSGSPVDVTFTAEAGKLIFFDSLDPDFDNVTVQILDPTSASVLFINASSDSSAGIVLPRSGTYTVRISGTGDYNFQILDLQANATALSLGTATSGPMAAATTQAYRFTGSSGQRLYYDALDPDGDSINVSLLRPDGTIISLNQSAESDRAPFTLTDSGSYYLLFRNTATTAADFNFRLSDLSSVSALSFDTVTTGTLSPGRETDLYRFTGSAGQRLVFDSQTTSTSANWYLYGPTNQQLSGSGSNIITDFELNLPADGTYILAIDGSSATDLNYSFSLVTPTTSTTPLSLNTPVSSTLAELGEQDIYTFTGTVGQRLYYDALKNDFSDTFSARLVDPTGDIVSLNQDADSDRGPFTLTEAGTYQLVFESASVVNPDTGSYNFQLLDLAAATALNFDTVTTGTLSPGRETDLYRFTGSAGTAPRLRQSNHIHLS